MSDTNELPVNPQDKPVDGANKESEKPSLVSLPQEEIARLYGLARELDDFRKAQQTALEEKENARLVEQAKRGEIEDAFKRYRDHQEAKVAALEGTILTERRDSSLNESLAGVKWRSEVAAAMAARILRDKIQAVRTSDGTIAVQDTKGLPVRDAVTEWLKSPEALLLIEASTQGGAGVKGTEKPGDATEVKAGSLADLTNQMRQRAVQSGMVPGFGGFPGL